MKLAKVEDKIFQYLEKDFWEDKRSYSSVESLVETVCGDSEAISQKLEYFIHQYLETSSRMSTEKTHYLEKLSSLKGKMSGNHQKQETTVLESQKKCQEFAQELKKERTDAKIKEKRVIRGNEIDLKNSESFTESQKQFISYLQSDFFNDRSSGRNAETLVLFKCSVQFQVLNLKIRTFMNDVINGNIKISSPEEYSVKLKDLFKKINQEVFLPSEPPKLDNSQNWAQPLRSTETDEPKIFQKSDPMQDYFNNLMNGKQTGLTGPLNGHQIEVEVEPDGYSTDIQCRVEFRQIDIDELKPFLIKFLDTFTGKEITLPRKGMNSYSPVEKIHVNDEFGLWSYDHFQGCIDISFRSPDGRPLQKKIKLEKNYFKSNPHLIDLVKSKYEPAIESERNDISMSLEEFLSKVVDLSGKEENFVETWIDKFKSNDVHRFEEIFAWGENDWHQANLPVNAKKLIRTHLNQFRVKVDKSQEAHELTEAEKYAVVHRIKRFFIWKTRPKKLNRVPYIDKRALNAGFREINEEYAGDDLLLELKMFYNRFTTPKSYSKSIAFSRGLLLYGPPGTGKSELTKAIASKIGLTPVSFALCAAEVNRPHVGETEMVLEALCARAQKIPYLWCCIAVDEIDVLTPKRDEKSSEHKMSALGTLLGLIGGIKDVSNLMFLASTNFLTKIDEAWRRRMSGQFFVGRASPQARWKIFKLSDQTFLNDHLIEELVNLTTNFSGAALKQYISYVVSETKDENETKQTSQKSLSYEKLAELAAVTSKQFNIRLGSYSLPELFFNQKPKETLLGASFLNLLEGNNILLLNFKKNIVEVLYKCCRTTKPTILTQKPKKIVELGNLKVLNDLCQDARDFVANLQLPRSNSQSKKEFFVDYVDLHKAPRFQKTEIHDYLTQKVQDFKKNAASNPSRKCILVWLDLLSQAVSNNVDSRIIKSWFQINFKDLGPQKNHYHFFATSESKCSDMLEMIYWKDLASLNKNKINFSGRIMIDLSEEEPEMRFETDGKEGSGGLYSEPLLLDNSAGLKLLQVIPSIVKFASERKIDFILLLDQDFLLANHAFDESKTKENIAEKMEEFKSYPRSLLVIDVDSIAGMVKSFSDSSMGPSTSYNLADAKLYNMILHYVTSIPQVYIAEETRVKEGVEVMDQEELPYANDDKKKIPPSEYWIALISKNKELSKMIKKDIAWPKTQKEIEEAEKEEEKQKETICLRCGETYIEAKNELNHCTYHDGFLFEGSAPSYDWEIIETVKEAKKLAFIKNARQKKSASNQTNQNKEIQFNYICCLEPLNSQGCQKHKHINDEKLLAQLNRKVRSEYEEKLTDLQLGLDSI